MTFTSIVAMAATRLNLTSPEALLRIGDNVNERYRWLASDLGFSTIQQTSASATTTIGNRDLVFGPAPVKVQKILAVYNPLYTPPAGVLDEATFDELRNSVTGSDPARAYAIKKMGADSVTVYLSSIPATAYTLTADVLANLTDLAGTNVPAFAEDFHNILVYGAMATELDKMEKYDLSQKKEAQFVGRLEQLRYYIHKSAYLKRWQGKHSNRGPFVPLL